MIQFKLLSHVHFQGKALGGLHFLILPPSNKILRTLGMEDVCAWLRRLTCLRNASFRLYLTYSQHPWWLWKHHTQWSSVPNHLWINDSWAVVKGMEPLLLQAHFNFVYLTHNFLLKQIPAQIRREQEWYLCLQRLLTGTFFLLSCSIKLRWASSAMTCVLGEDGEDRVYNCSTVNQNPRRLRLNTSLTLKYPPFSSCI